MLPKFILPETMNCIEIKEPGEPEVLISAKRPVPSPTANEVLVKVEAAGINGPDLMQRRGLYPPPKGSSDLLGLEIAGEIVSIGREIKGWKIGDLVCALTNGGGYAEFCSVNASHCLPIPDGFSTAMAASLPETYFTIWSNIFMGSGLKSEDVFLVHGGAGGLGTTSIQLGKAFGAKVVVTDSPSQRTSICTELGADRVIDYTKEDFVEVIRNEFGGADVILDIVGGDNIARNIKAAKPDGRIVQLAFTQGSTININLMPIMLKRLVFTGSTLRSRSNKQKAIIAAELKKIVWPLFKNGQLKPVARTTLPLDQAAKGHKQMESATHTGKIILTV